MRKKLNLSLFALMLLVGYGLMAQRNIQAPVLQDFAACASLDSNAFTVIAILGPGDALPNNNEFVLQRSDEVGNFDAPVELARASGPNNGSGAEQDIVFEDFAIPIDSNSDTYKLRVISSTNDNIISAISEDTAMHFFADNVDISLNDRKPVIFCDGGSFSKDLVITLRDSNTDQPVDANTYNWNWYKDGDLIPGVSAPTLTVTSVGQYYAQIPLGNCERIFAFSRSNNVNVSVVTVSEITISTPAPDFSFCPDEEKRLVSSETNFSYQYQWYKDDEPIEGAVGPEIVLPDNDFGGEYFLEVDLSDDCQGLRTDSVTVVNEGSSITDPLPEFLVLIPRQTINLEVTTDAPVGSPYRWIVDTSPLDVGVLDGPTTSFEASIIANYRIEIDANDPCDTRLFSETDVLAPSGFEIEIGTDEDVDCEAETIPIKLLNMYGRTSIGLVPLTEEQLDFFDFEWFKDGVSLGIANPDPDGSYSLEITRSDEGGIYELRADLRTGEFSGIVSNALPIIFLGDIILEVDPIVLSDGGSVTLTAPFDDSFTYEWYERIGGEDILIENETANTLEVFEEGDYFARIITPLCPVDSQIREVRKEIGVAEIIPNIVTPNGDGINDNWLLPQEYINNPEVEVTIYNIRGVVDATTTNYQNDWPLQISNSQGEDPIYYFVITKNSEVIRKGSITVMK